MAVVIVLPYLVFFGILGAAVLWKLYQLAHAPRNAPLRAVTLCLLCAVVSYPLAMPAGSSGFDGIAGHGTAKLAQNVLLLATMYFLMCFYLYSATDGTAGRRRARWEGLAAGLVIVAVTAAALSGPHQALSGSFATADMTVGRVAVFYLVAGMYLMYATAAACWWTQRYARLSQRPHATGLWLTAVGLALMAGACAVRGAFVVIRNQGGVVSPELTGAIALLLMVAIMLFTVGVSYTGARSRLAALQIRQKRRRLYRRLHPLWQLLSEACPETVLRPASAARRDRWSVHRRYHRRVVECRDGLVSISPYLRGQAGPSGTVAQQVARRIHDAAGGGTALLDIPWDRSAEADVEQLAALSDALARSPSRNSSRAKASHPC